MLRVLFPIIAVAKERKLVTSAFTFNSPMPLISISIVVTEPCLLDLINDVLEVWAKDQYG